MQEKPRRPLGPLLNFPIHCTPSRVGALRDALAVRVLLVLCSSRPPHELEVQVSVRVAVVCSSPFTDEIIESMRTLIPVESTSAAVMSIVVTVELGEGAIPR